MKKQFWILGVLLFGLQTMVLGQSMDALRGQIANVLAGKDARVGVFIRGIRPTDTVSFRSDERFAFQSVFKLHIAIAVLAEVDKGKLRLDQPIEITKSDLLPNFYSPIHDKYPDGCTLPLGEVIGYMVSQSDNVGCDVLIRILGGAKKVEKYFKKRGFKGISIKLNEEVQQKNWDLQFQNWTTPRSSDAVLGAFWANEWRKKPLLSSKSHDFLWKVMRETSTGKNRLVRHLPIGTVVAHKTGSSGTKNGITEAVHDIGVVQLPNGAHFFISILVGSSTESNEVNEKIIADIARLSWDFFTNSGVFEVKK